MTNSLSWLAFHEGVVAPIREAHPETTGARGVDGQRDLRVISPGLEAGGRC